MEHGHVVLTCVLDPPLIFGTQGLVPEGCNNSVPGINVPYSRNTFIPRINSVLLE